jgi:hypothetical protein
MKTLIELTQEIEDLKRKNEELVNIIKELAGIGSWGNYMAFHYLQGINIDNLRIPDDEKPRLIKQSLDYESICAKYLIMIK